MEVFFYADSRRGGDAPARRPSKKETSAPASGKNSPSSSSSGTAQAQLPGSRPRSPLGAGGASPASSRPSTSTHQPQKNQQQGSLTSRPPSGTTSRVTVSPSPGSRSPARRISSQSLPHEEQKFARGPLPGRSLGGTITATYNSTSRSGSGSPSNANRGTARAGSSSSTSPKPTNANKGTARAGSSSTSPKLTNANNGTARAGSASSTSPKLTNANNGTARAGSASSTSPQLRNEESVREGSSLSSSSPVLTSASPGEQVEDESPRTATRKNVLGNWIKEDQLAEKKFQDLATVSVSTDETNPASSSSAPLGGATEVPNNSASEDHSTASPSDVRGRHIKKTTSRKFIRTRILSPGETDSDENNSSSGSEDELQNEGVSLSGFTRRTVGGTGAGTGPENHGGVGQKLKRNGPQGEAAAAPPNINRQYVQVSPTPDEQDDPATRTPFLNPLLRLFKWDFHPKNWTTTRATTLCCVGFGGGLLGAILLAWVANGKKPGECLQDALRLQLRTLKDACSSLGKKNMVMLVRT